MHSHECCSALFAVLAYHWLMTMASAFSSRKLAILILSLLLSVANTVMILTSRSSNNAAFGSTTDGGFRGSITWRGLWVCDDRFNGRIWGGKIANNSFKAEAAAAAFAIFFFDPVPSAVTAPIVTLMVNFFKWGGPSSPTSWNISVSVSFE